MEGVVKVAVAAHHELRRKIDEVWSKVSFSKEKIETNFDVHPGWKTVRIFVSSTFKDFHQEREELVKRVFADLRRWCEERQLHLIDCDLRWGVPKDTTSESTLRTCLEEIDRCYEDNKVPFFLNMTCKRAGWVPLEKDLPGKVLEDYPALVFGLSVTEMEIVHAACRIENPNALFLIREEKFLDEIEDTKVKKQFIDEVQPMAEEKLKVLKEKIKNHFKGRVITYKCSYCPDENLATSRPKLNLDPQFSTEVYKFFKERIEQQYPLVELKVDPFVESRFHHEAFMKSRSESGLRVNRKGKNTEMVIGREDVLKQIEDYIENDISGYPKVIVGVSGAGKSTIMAKAANDAFEMIQKKKSDVWKVFFHFVGAVPKSTNLFWLLQRILKELDPNIELPDKLQELAALVNTKLASSRLHFIVFIDALNQIDEETHIEPLFWLPENLSPNVRCILSLIDDTKPHLALKQREHFQDMEILVPDLKPSKCLEIVTSYFGMFNKTLTAEQGNLFMDKESSKNPLWLRIACEELRIYGEFSKVEEFIKNLKDGLPELLQQVLERFEAESDKNLLKSTLCLLEVSKFGLLEDELLQILVDKDRLEYDEARLDESPAELGSDEEKRRIPYVEWVSVYRNLKVFLRPYGNPGEGRLNFYHDALRKVVRSRYLDQGKSEDDHSKKLFWWHKKLADFYRTSGTYDRKVEEFPEHLLFLKWNARNEADTSRYCEWLRDFVLNEEIFKRLYDSEYSSDLLFYWRESGDEYYDELCRQYKKQSEDIERDTSNSTNTPIDRCLKLEQFSRVMIQAGRWKESLELAERCLELLTDPSNGIEKDKRDENLMYLYSHIARIKSFSVRISKPKDEISERLEIIDWHSKAIKIIRSSNRRSEKEFKSHLALQLNQTAFARSEIYRVILDSSAVYNLLTGKKDLKKEMIVEGVKEVEESIKIFDELNDYAHGVDALITKGYLFKEKKTEQFKIYEEASKRCREIFGDKHKMMCRICYSAGIAYENAKDTENAYEHFRKAYDLGLEVYGAKHSTTEFYRKALMDKKYVAIAKRLGHSIDCLRV